MEAVICHSSVQCVISCFYNTNYCQVQKICWCVYKDQVQYYDHQPKPLTAEKYNVLSVPTHSQASWCRQVLMLCQTDKFPILCRPFSSLCVLKPSVRGVTVSWDHGRSVTSVWRSCCHGDGSSPDSAPCLCPVPCSMTSEPARPGSAWPD